MKGLGDHGVHALMILAEDQRGVTADVVGGKLWPDRAGRAGHSAWGGGDYPAQMLLGRLRKLGLVRVLPLPGPESSKWVLTDRGRRIAEEAKRQRIGPRFEG